MIRNAGYWINRLCLSAHKEGGYFREIFRSTDILPGTEPGSGSGKSLYTSIFYLLKSGQCSRFHRLASDEIWHFYKGSQLKIIILEKHEIVEKILGDNPEAGETLQALVPAGKWFAAFPMAEKSFTLAGCSMSPGFEYRNFELGDRDELSKEYPEHKSIIEQLT